MHAVFRVVSRVLPIVVLLGLLLVQVSERSTVSAFFNKESELDQPHSSEVFKDNFNLLPNCTPTSEPLIGVSFENQKLMEANFTMCKLVQANFIRALMVDTKFLNADCRGANFSYAVMTGVDIRGTDLQNAVFSHTDLTGMNYNNMTKFTGARYDKFTRFPITFVPQAHGMVKMD
jgi:uncharacterized protein YjbI with pentapeptide repeats